MNTFQIAESALENYKNNKLSDERFDFLVAQVNEQMNEISENKELYDSFLSKVNAPQKTDNIILWILIMSNEELCSEYISEFDKAFNDIVPVSDLADLLFYVVYLKKIKNITLDGFDYLSAYEDEDMQEVDTYCITNVLAYIQKSKEIEIQF
jgi:hypothetical protein